MTSTEALRLEAEHDGPSPSKRKEDAMNRGLIGTIIGILVIIVLVIVIMQLT